MAAKLDVEILRRQCWDRAIHAFATATVLERRAAALQRKTRALTFLGIIGPLLVGGLVLSFGATASWVPGLLVAASVLGVVQLVLSVWSLVASWNAAWAYAQESASDNYRLSDAYQKLGTNPPKDLEVRFELVEASYLHRSSADVARGVSAEEKRQGHRVALHRFARECPKCKVIPNPDAPTSCSNCGQ